MTSPIQRVRRGAFFLGFFSCFAILLHFFVSEGGTLLESVYWFVISISTVGYGQKVDISPEMQIVTIFVLLVGISLAGYTFGGLLQLMTEGEIQRVLGVRKMTREIGKLKDHIIVCGYGRVGYELVEQLAKNGIEFVIVEENQERVSDATERGYLAYQGDATTDKTLLHLGITDAKSLVTTLGTDSDNLFLTLSARNLNPELEIIARGEHPETESKLLQAGATRVVLPTVIGAKKIATLLTLPHTAELLDKAIETGGLEVSIHEMLIPVSSPIVGKAIRDVFGSRQFNLLIVAVRSSEGKMTFNPRAEHHILANDTIITLGPPNDVAAFRIEFSL